MIKKRKLRPSTFARFTPGQCLNCDKSSRQLYCSLACSQTAKLVRYARRKRARGEFSRPDIKEAIEIRLAFIIGSGGYDEKARRIPPETRTEVYARAAGKCQKCGRTFGDDPDSKATIQHLNASANNISNLQAWCMRCNKDDALSKFVPITDDEHRAEAFTIVMRWEAKKPLRLCDDQLHWNDMWRNLQAANVEAYDRLHAKN